MSLSALSEAELPPSMTLHNSLFSDILDTPIKATLPSLLRTVTPANIGRRRRYSASLFSSPARHSHQHQMSAIFQNAATSLSTRRLDFSPRSTVNEETIGSTIGTDGAGNLERLDVLNYPALPRIQDSSSPLTRFRPLIPARTPATSLNSPENRKDAKPQSTQTIKALPFLLQLGRPGATKLGRNDSGISIDYVGSSSSSTSSASWTGDSQFFIKKPREGPTHERQCSVSKWLDLLPEKPDEHLEAGFEDIVPLSPSVEVERGSKRRRRRERKARARCVSLNDDDIFSAVLR
jgi:hypothetical protein